MPGRARPVLLERRHQSRRGGRHGIQRAAGRQPRAPPHAPTAKASALAGTWRAPSGVRSQTDAAIARFGPTALSQAHDLLDQLPDAIDSLAFDLHSGSEASWVSALAAMDSARRPRAVPEDDWNGFLASSLGRSGLLTRSGEGFAFLHQTLQEYCAARHIARDPSAHAA